MDIKTLFEDNIANYSDIVDEDIAENMKRVYYRGLVGHDPDDESVLSLLIWEIKSVAESWDTESELKWIYTADPSYIALLLDSYSEEAHDESVRRTYFESTSLNAAQAAKLTEKGFSLKPVEGLDISVTLDDCAKLSIAKKKAPSYVKSLILLDEQEFCQGLMNILFKYDNPALQDLAYLPKEWFEQLVSCYIKTDDTVTGFLLVHPCPSGILVPVLFFSVGADYRMNLIEMLRFSIHSAMKIYPDNTIIRIRRRNKAVRDLSGRLFPDKKGEPAISGERMEEI